MTKRKFDHEVFHDFMLATETEMQISVMPAWTAGILVRKDASGDIHVNLDSSTPCWNDAIEGLFELTETATLRIFKPRTRNKS
ncbi:MAG TPA: hypothetical protein VI585_08370 [Candidatus Binatia bacterium]